LQNLVYLAQRGKLSEIRTVVVPGQLPNAETVLKTAALVSPFIPAGQVVPYKLIRFRPYGVREMAKGFAVPSDVEMADLQQLLITYPRLRAVVV
jgi:pyruvate formate lyase activating enzyme